MNQQEDLSTPAAAGAGVKSWLESLWDDLRQGVRSLGREPIFVALVVGTLTVGIGVNTAIFSLVDHVVLRPLPYPSAENLYFIGVRDAFGNFESLRDTDLEDLRGLTPAFAAIGTFSYGGLTLTDGDSPYQPTVLYVDRELLEIAALKPLHGRVFLPEELEPAGPATVIVGEELWRERYGADPALVGRTLEIDEKPVLVVGIAPDSFRFPYEKNAIQMLTPNRRQADGRLSNWYVTGFGRLAPGAGLDQAAAQLEAVTARLAEKAPERFKNRRLEAAPAYREVVGDVRQKLLLLWGAVVFVMVLACLNAANLLLARGMSRQRDVAVCVALGAGRWRILQRVLLESTVLAVTAGALGLLLAQGLLELFVAWDPVDLPRTQELGLDLRIFAATFLASLVAGLLYGLIPAWQARRVDVAEAMKENSGRGTTGRGGLRLRAALTIAEVAIAFTLLIGAGLMLRTAWRLEATDPGFDATDRLALTLWADLPRDSKKDDTVRFYDEILDATRALPGVSGATVVQGTPFDDVLAFQVSYQVDLPSFAAMEPAMAQRRAVNEDYFTVLDIPLVAGRFFDHFDSDGKKQVVVVNDALARLYGGAQALVGTRLLAGRERVPVEVVGVVRGLREQGLDHDPLPTVYLPFRQFPANNMTMIVATKVESMSLARAVQDVIWQRHPTQGIWRTRTVQSMIDESLRRPRFFASAFLFFALVAVLLAAAGIYGVISYNVGLRRREIGIRIALGASEREVLGGVLYDASRLALAGMAVGLGGALLVGRLLTGFLFEIQPFDPPTYLLVALFLMATALLSSLVPARLAAKTPPSICLRAS